MRIFIKFQRHIEFRGKPKSGERQTQRQRLNEHWIFHEVIQSHLLHRKAFAKQSRASLAGITSPGCLLFISDQCWKFNYFQLRENLVFKFEFQTHSNWLEGPKSAKNICTFIIIHNGNPAKIIRILTPFSCLSKLSSPVTFFSLLSFAVIEKVIS